VQTKVVDSRWFVGLPAPAAAGAVCSLLFFAPVVDGQLRFAMQVTVAGALLLIGMLMVSTFRYRSFKTVDLSRKRSYRMAIPLAAVVLVVIYMPRATFLAIAILYTLSAPLTAIFHRLTHRTHPEPAL
jgi:CDP-diacylglycerol--serine O-phosphatidyltransferase